MLDMLQKQLCRTISLSLAASLKPLTHCQNVASLSHLNWLNWFLHFSITIPSIIMLKLYYLTQGNRLYEICLTNWCFDKCVHKFLNNLLLKRHHQKPSSEKNVISLEFLGKLSLQVKKTVN